MEGDKVTIIVLNWNGKKDTIECLESLERIDYPDYEIIVVDNASTDGSVELIREKFARVKIIQNKENLGFAEGMNVGIRIVNSQQSIVNSQHRPSTNQCILLLNQDVVVDKNFLRELVEVAESDTKIGIVGPKIYYYLPSNPASSIQHPASSIWACGTRFATGSAFKMKIPYVAPVPIGCGEEDKGQYDNLKEVSAITGCCMLIKSEVIDRIGLLDNRFFIIHEDDDYCIRARKAGYKVCVVPKSIIWHKVSTAIRSGVGSQESGVRSRIINASHYEGNLLAIYYGTRNWLLVVRKHFGSQVFLKLLFANITKILPTSLFNLLKKRKLSIKVMLAFLYAYLDALTLTTPKRFLK